jgi:hypothetical protein
MRRNTLIALAALAVPLAVVAVMLPPRAGGGPKTAANAEVFPNLKDWIGQATKLTVTGPSGTIAIEKKPAADGKAEALGEGWVLPSKGGYPVQTSTIRQILAGLVALKTVDEKTSRPKLYGRLDLGDPGKGSQSHELKLTKADGASILELIVGKHKYDALAQGNDGIYVRKADDPRTWLARPAFDTPAEETGWIDRKIVDIDAAGMKRIVLTPSGGKPLEIGRDKAEDKLTVKDFPKGAKPREEDPTEGIAGAFRYLDLDDVAPAAQLGGTVEGTAHFETFDGLVGDLTIYKQDGHWVTVAAKGEGASTGKADEIAKRTGGWAYKIADARAATLESKMSDLIQEEKPATPEKPGAPEAPALPGAPKAKAAEPK